MHYCTQQSHWPSCWEQHPSVLSIRTTHWVTPNYLFIHIAMWAEPSWLIRPSGCSCLGCFNFQGCVCVYISPCKALCVCVHVCVCVFLSSLPLGSCPSLGLQTPDFTFSLSPMPFFGRSCVRKQAPHGFNHFVLKAELLSALIRVELLEEGLGARLACPWSPLHTAPTSDRSHKMEHSSLILPLNQGT